MSESNSDILYNKKDYSSYANIDEVISTDIKLDWTLDFETSTISGSVDHIVKVLVDNVAQVHFDSRKIHLLGDILINNIKANVIIGKEDIILGTKITVEIPIELRKKDSLFSVHFPYAVDSEASAVQWLAPSATKGGKFPYVFTQCQAIHARSLFPCMDSPGVKTPYTARVVAPKWCTVLMSALASKSITDNESVDTTKYNVFNFTQPVPTSPYLVALAGGNLTGLDISSRVRIWSEPEVIDAAHNEFTETEDFVLAAEAITGCPYQWTRYDVICLPPSFPYGGMENPCLTFATPTLLAGDRSLADVIAHEIAHSWTGNLVTNTVWDHFWLNEGWTVWLERKITSRVKRNNEVGKLSAEIGLVHLNESIAQQGADSKFTQLVWPLRGEDPDDAFSSVPYEKGFNLLNYLENLVGSDNFDVFVKSYIQEFKFKTVTTGEFRDHFVSVITKKLSELPAVNPTAGKKKKKNNHNTAPPEISEANQQILNAIKALDWDGLFLSRGLPTYPIDFKNSLSIGAKVLARSWLEISKETNNKKFTPSKSDTKGWSSQQICLFLDQLLEFSAEHTFSVATLEKLADLYGFNKTKNAEICLRWQSLGLKSNAPWIVDQVTEFITSQGRMKFVRPLYRLLRTSEVGGEIANEIFEKSKLSYHPIARKMLEIDLNRLNEQARQQKIAQEAESTEKDDLNVSNGNSSEAATVETDNYVHVVDDLAPSPVVISSTTTAAPVDDISVKNTAAITSDAKEIKVETVVIDAIDIPREGSSPVPVVAPAPSAAPTAPPAAPVVVQPVAPKIDTPSAPAPSTTSASVTDPLWEKATTPSSTHSRKSSKKEDPEPSKNEGILSVVQNRAWFAALFAGAAIASYYIFRSFKLRR